MRLLNVYTKKFSEFDDKNIPPYAIASHRWCGDEAHYKDISKNKNRASEGLKKVEGFCKFVRDENDRKTDQGRSDEVCLWIWLDTVCINKDSETDVSESINSMFRWYRRADVCYAYLVDVRPLTIGREAVMLDFRHSKWFTRGWTLQELIAPRQVVFLTSAWEIIGVKGRSAAKGKSEDLGALIADITGIPKSVFGDQVEFDLDSLTPAERSSWIQRRETKKTEDIAYCLLGILDVNMSLIYGERGKAWQRLEEEVSKRYKTVITLPKPDVLNKRLSGLHLSSWLQRFQPKTNRGDEETQFGSATITTATETSKLDTIASTSVPRELSSHRSRRLSPSSTAIPAFRPDKLGEDLLKASLDGDELVLEELLRNGIDLNYRDRSGLTALHYATLSGSHNTVDMLITADADINAPSLELGTPLCLAALQRRAHMVELLLNKGANVNEPGRWVGYPLHCASWSGCCHTVATLISYGADATVTSPIWTTFLEHGSRVGSSAATEYEQVTRRSSETKHEIYECQPIVIAIDRRHESIVQRLLDAKVPINAEHRFFWSDRPDEESFEDIAAEYKCEHESALMAASWKGPSTLLSKLINANAEINKRDSWGRSALWIAVQSGQVTNVQVLINAGAVVNAVSNSGKSVLHVAIEAGHADVVEYLLKKGADVDRADNNARTACHFAAFKGYANILTMLLSRNARYSARDRDDRTPLHAALTIGDHVKTVECLLKHGANPLAPDKDGRTPLHYAANKGSHAVALLLEYGADRSILDRNGYKAAAYLHVKTPNEIRRKLSPKPREDEIPRSMWRDLASTSFGRVDSHGRSLSDSSSILAKSSSRKNSRDVSANGEDPTTRSGSV